MSKWTVMMKKADFEENGRLFQISPVLARIIRNREIIEKEEIQKFLYGTMDDMYNPFLLKDMEKAIAILEQKIAEQKKIRIIGDYDIDGVCSTYILYKGLTQYHANVDTVIPHRMKDGYGLNDNLIMDAFHDGVDTILTCDNGIAASKQIQLAKELGMTVIITDHHEVPYEEIEGVKHYILPEADAVIDPKQESCKYPFQEICGAVVAYKCILAYVLKQEHKQCREILTSELLLELLEFAAFATIGDVMELKDENRIIVREGLKLMQNTRNMGLASLMEVTGIKADNIKPYTIGFVLGPCLNATGRLDTANNALDLFIEKDKSKSMMLASTLKAMNDSRKALTLEGVEDAIRQIEENHYEQDKVLVVYLPHVHESLAGIIAGRLRERYGKPTFVLTDGEECVKGSGRSIDSFHMYEEMTKCKDLFLKYGGHKLAAGLSLEKENVIKMRQRMNAQCTLLPEDFEEKVQIDVPMPMEYVSFDFIHQLDLLEPFGNGNPKPLFAQKNVLFQKGTILGQNRNVGKYVVLDENGKQYEMIYFGDLEQFDGYIVKKYGQHALEQLYSGTGSVLLSVVYYPDINEYRGTKSLQMILKFYQ